METTKLAKSPKYSRSARPLNRFGQWCAARGYAGPKLDELLGVGANTSYHYIRPLDHPRFSVPPAGVMARIHLLTEGAIGPADFYDLPALPADAAAPTPDPVEGEAA